MTHSMHRATADRGHAVVTRTSWARALVQRRADDVVLAAAPFKPNAVGSCEFSSSAGFGQRQILKARGAYLGGRVLLGVTPLHVHALVLFLGHRAARAVACWPRTELEVAPIGALGNTVDLAWPALLLADRYGNVLAELQVMQRDDETWRVLALLLG